jgi:hypothetical protein
MPTGGTGSGGIEPTGGKASLAGAGGVAGGAGLGSTGGESGLVCHPNAMGVGKSDDPCGCPCCWARDCLNTEACCAGFCVGADSGKGCCAP